MLKPSPQPLKSPCRQLPLAKRHHLSGSFELQRSNRTNYLSTCAWPKKVLGGQYVLKESVPCIGLYKYFVGPRSLGLKMTSEWMNFSLHSTRKQHHTILFVNCLSSTLKQAKGWNFFAYTSLKLVACLGLQTFVVVSLYLLIAHSYQGVPLSALSFQ